MKIWVAGLPQAWSSQKLAAALNNLGMETNVFPLSECVFSIDRGQIFWKKQDLEQLDGIVVRKLGDPADPLSHYRVNLLHHLNNRGVPVISSPVAIEIANNRYSMTVKLGQAGIPIPETIITESVEQAMKVVEKWGRAVLKPLFTSKGRGMALLDSSGAYRLTLKYWQDIGRFPLYLQRYVKAQHDMGIAVLDGKVLGAFRRVAGGSWQTTIREGGHYETCQPDDETLDIALKAAAIFGLDYTIVDIVMEEKKRLVYEVSAFGGFSGLEACGTDAASIYAEYAVKKITGGKYRNERA